MSENGNSNHDKTNPDWFRWYPTKWASGVIGLTPEQRGVYMDVINIILDRGECPEDYDYLGYACNCQRRRLKRIVRELVEAGKLTQVRGKLCQNKAEKERKESENFSETQRKRVRNRWSKTNDVNDLDHTISADTKTTTTTTTVEPNGSIPLNPPNGNGKDNARQIPLTDICDWQPDEQDRQYAEAHGLDPERILADVHDWAANAVPSKRRKRDPSRFWQGWCRREADRSPGHPWGNSGSKRSGSDSVLRAASRVIARGNS